MTDFKIIFRGVPLFYLISDFCFEYLCIHDPRVQRVFFQTTLISKEIQFHLKLQL